MCPDKLKIIFQSNVNGIQSKVNSVSNEALEQYPELSEFLEEVESELERMETEIDSNEYEIVELQDEITGLKNIEPEESVGDFMEIIKHKVKMQGQDMTQVITELMRERGEYI